MLSQYQYDDQGRIQTHSVSQQDRNLFQRRYAHDPAGNLLGQGDQPAANLANVKGNRLLMQGDRHYDYDAYSNQIRERRGTGQKLVTEYRYDC
nr:hypothetical protein [Pseudomonas viridiflava]